MNSSARVLQFSLVALLFPISSAVAVAQGGTIYKCNDATGGTFYTTDNPASSGSDCKPIPRTTVVVPPSPSTEEPATDAPSNSPTSAHGAAIPLRMEGGTLVLPVLINNRIALNFVIDSGAADVTIPQDVVLTLMRTGTLKRSDFFGTRIYVLADGSRVPSQTFRIQSLKVGARVVENVTGSVTPVQGSLLLGQSFLRRFKSWKIDNRRQVLLLE